MEAFQGLGAKLFEAVEDAIQGLLFHISGFREELIGEADQLFLGSDGKEVPWGEWELLLEDLLAVQSGAGVSFANACQGLHAGQAAILPAVFPEHLCTQKAVPEIVFRALTENRGRVALSHADIMKECACLHEGGIQGESAMLQQLQGLLAHLFAVMLKESSKRGVFGIEEAEEFLGIQSIHNGGHDLQAVCGSASLAPPRDARNEKGLRQ